MFALVPREQLENSLSELLLDRLQEKGVEMILIERPDYLQNGSKRKNNISKVLRYCMKLTGASLYFKFR